LTIEEKKRMLLAGHVAVYDVIRACEIIGSSDSSIRNVVPADIKSIVAHTSIRAVFTNGKTAGRLYKKYQAEHIRLPMITLPSTSPANAAFSLEQLEEIWKQELGRYL
jgi:TDG/mug DNA glycosylase family protein